MRPRTVSLPLLVALVSGCSAASPAASPARQAGPSPIPSVTQPAERATTVPTPSATPRPSRTTRPSATPARTPADPLSPAPPLESAPPIGQPTCSASAITVVDADAVVVPDSWQEIYLVRTTGRACQLHGWPAVQLFAADGSRLPLSVQHGGLGLPRETPAPITIDAHTTASFAIASARGGGCTPTTRVSVTLPGTTAARSAATTIPVCGTTIAVSPIHRSADNESSGG